MKKALLTAICTVCMVAACSDGEKAAQERLAVARKAYEAGNYNMAKNEIDSIKTLYPKAFKTRKQGLRLMQVIEIAEQQKTIAYLDSANRMNDAAIAEILPQYKFEKDTAYQDLGIYTDPSQDIARNINTSYLYARVDEQGVMKLTSVYFGSGKLNHKAIRVTAPDNSFAETPQSTDTFQATNVGIVTERTDYNTGTDGDVTAFIDMNKDKTLKVEYIGDRKYSYTMTKANKEAVSKVYRLAKLLATRTEIKKQRTEASNRMEFFKRKSEEAMTKDNAGK